MKTLLVFVIMLMLSLVTFTATACPLNASPYLGGCSFSGCSGVNVDCKGGCSACTLNGAPLCVCDSGYTATSSACNQGFVLTSCVQNSAVTSPSAPTSVTTQQQQLLNDCTKTTTATVSKLNVVQGILCYLGSFSQVTISVYSTNSPPDTFSVWMVTLAQWNALNQFGSSYTPTEYVFQIALNSQAISAVPQKIDIPAGSYYLLLKNQNTIHDTSLAVSMSSASWAPLTDTRNTCVGNTGVQQLPPATIAVFYCATTAPNSLLNVTLNITGGVVTYIFCSYSNWNLWVNTARAAGVKYTVPPQLQFEASDLPADSYVQAVYNTDNSKPVQMSLGNKRKKNKKLSFFLININIFSL